MKKLLMMTCAAAIAVFGVVFSAFADPAPGVKIALELKPGANNPRNSGGGTWPGGAEDRRSNLEGCACAISNGTL